DAPQIQVWDNLFRFEFLQSLGEKPHRLGFNFLIEYIHTAEVFVKIVRKHVPSAAQFIKTRNVKIHSSFQMTFVDTSPSQPLFPQPLAYFLVTQALLTVLVIGYFLHVQGVYFRRSKSVNHGATYEKYVLEKSVLEVTEVDGDVSFQECEKRDGDNVIMEAKTEIRGRGKEFASKNGKMNNNGKGEGEVQKGGIGNVILGELEKRRNFRNQTRENK
ncbi:9724_t:CDS:2, partial [Acaulospora morrowiae]